MVAKCVLNSDDTFFFFFFCYTPLVLFGVHLRLPTLDIGHVKQGIKNYPVDEKRKKMMKEITHALSFMTMCLHVSITICGSIEGLLRVSGARSHFGGCRYNTH